MSVIDPVTFVGEIVVSGTSGSILYVDSTGHLAQDNSHLTWDASGTKLAVTSTVATTQGQAFTTTINSTNAISVYGGLFTVTNSASINPNTGVGLGIALADATTLANTNYGLALSVTLTNNAAKVGYGLNALVSTSSTTADTLAGFNFQSQVTGAISTGTRAVYGSRAIVQSTAANSGGISNLYGVYGSTSMSGSSTGSTVNAYGGYFTNSTRLTTNGTLNSYGVYITNDGLVNGTGTTTQYGLFMEAIANADTNYSIYLQGGAVHNDDWTASQALFTDASKNMVSNAITGSGSVVMSTSPTIATPTITTSMIAPIVNGGTAAGSTLILQSTSGTGTSDSISLKTGSQVTRLSINTSGNVTIAAPASGSALSMTGVAGNYGLNFTGANSSGASYGAFFVAGSTNADFALRIMDMGATLDRLCVRGDGFVGIGTASPTTQFHTTGTARMANFGAGAATFDASGNISSVSDERLKDIQDKYLYGIEVIEQIEPILYKWNKESGMETEHTYLGFSAQNVQKASKYLAGENSQGYLSVQDRAILATLVNAVKDLNNELSEIRQHLNI